MKYFVKVLAIVLLYCTFVEETRGHGMMLNPAGRSSRWRFDPTALPNYDDNGLYCGGFSVQYNENNGKCGLCGDDYRDPTPRDNELGGLYGGSGVIVETYKQNDTIKSVFNITINHLGYTYYEICNLDEFEEESEECFKQNRLVYSDGDDRFSVGDITGIFDVELDLPKDLTCEHCVMRWIYYAGNNWGTCDDGESALGCGNQETFMSCADIRIT